LSKEEVDKMKTDAQAHSAEDKKRREEVDTKNQADNLVFQTRKQMKEFGDKIPSDLKSKVESAADALDAAIKNNNIADIKAKIEALNNIWNEASTAMYQKATAEAQQQQAAAQPPPPTGETNATDNGPQKNDKAVEDASFEVVDDKDK
jgi:molecular chaperone DnaK